MAKAKAPTTNGTTGTEGSATTSTTTATRKTRNPNDPVVYWDDNRKTALLALLYSRPGQLTGSQAAGILSGHPSFVDQQALFAGGDKTIGEKVRQQVIKLAKVAKEKGHPVPSLKRTSNVGGNIDNVFAQALAQVGSGQASMAQNAGVAGTGTGLVGGGIPLVPAGGQAVGGLIPVPQG